MTCDICNNPFIDPTPRRSNRGGGSAVKDPLSTMLNGKRGQSVNSNKNSTNKKSKRT